MQELGGDNLYLHAQKSTKGSQAIRSVGSRKQTTYYMIKPLLSVQVICAGFLHVNNKLQIYLPLIALLTGYIFFNIYIYI